MAIKLNAYYKNNRLLCNALFSVLQIIVVGFTYFIIYTLLLHKLGAEKLGIWSLILSTTSVANVATTGLTLSLVKYIAMCDANIDYIKINKYIKTGLFIVMLLTATIILIVYFLGSYFLPLVMPKANIGEALRLLPFSLFSLFLNGIAGVFLSSLEGLHHSTFRGIAYILSSIIFTIVAYLLIDQYGLIGIAIAQIIQAIFIILMGILFLKLLFRKLSFFPIIFDKEIFKEIFGYSASFQYIGICVLLVEPVVKFMISRFGGLSFVGFYEMASRLVAQIRALIISANQIMVPHVAKSTALNINKTDTTYPLLFKLVMYVSVYLMVLLIILSPVVSKLWIGYLNYMFITSLIILSSATIINLLSTPAYFSSMGVGKLNGILACHTTFLLLNAILGYILGKYHGGIGVVVGYSISFVISSLITIIYYHKVYNFSTLSLLNQNKEFSGIFFNLFIYILLGTLLIYSFNTLPILLYVILSFGLSFIYIYMVYVKDESIKLLITRIQKSK
jgi:O-antigen/teichoic acid export membrane protein